LLVSARRFLHLSGVHEPRRSFRSAYYVCFARRGGSGFAGRKFQGSVQVIER
jgi:hypothetical protein